MRIAVIGCGNICGIYLENLARWPETEVVACSDLDLSRAEQRVVEFGIPYALTPEQVIEAEDIDLVLNLTVPKAHFEVSREALESGKSVYVEKPLALSFEEGSALLSIAKERGLAIGCAPDTVLGAGIQTCREIIDSGRLGSIVGGNAFMLCPGHESWHPSPEFYYEKGGGPLFDMGPYYLSALFNLLGPIESVVAVAKTPLSQRQITSQPLAGKAIDVQTPTHIVAIYEFVCGAAVQFTSSFDVQRSSLPHIEIYGSEGSLIAPDPNGFGDAPSGIQTFFKGKAEWNRQAMSFQIVDNTRGLGVLDLVRAKSEGRAPRASGEIALHILEAMEKTLIAAETGSRQVMETRPDRPSPMPQSGI